MHHLLTYYILCFRHLPRQRTLRNSSKLRKFRTIRPHSPRITRNSHLLICALNKYFQIPNHKQSTPGNFSELRRFRTIRPHSRQITQNSRYLYSKVMYHLITITHLVIAPYPLTHTYLHIPGLVSHYYVV